MAVKDLQSRQTVFSGVLEDTNIDPITGEPYMVPVMGSRQRNIYRLLVLIWTLTILNFWYWWLDQDHIVTMSGMVLNSILLLWAIGLPAYFFYMAGRMHRPNPNLFIDPDSKVAMIVTKAPAEPWEVIERTLIAMKNQDYPYSYDVWLADEKPDSETIDWCFENDVHLSTRHNFNVFDVNGYQNEEFPRRSKSKEGNLSYFYDTYAEYDFVAQLDADHVPSPTYLKEVMRAFANPRIGYVAAPSICDANTDESWVVNGRLFMEASLHGALQAGYNGRWAPMAIGSHYAVRVEALKNLIHIRPKNFWSREFEAIIGGLGAELAEDHVTTLAMISRGYQGAFAFDAIASGDGAASIADSVTQEMQWSRSLMTVLLRWTYSYFKFGIIPQRIKAQFLFAQLWYPIFGVHMLISYQMSNIALILRAPWVNVSYPLFLVYFVPTMFGALMPILWLKRNGYLRPSKAKVMSWEMVLFVYIRWPWALWGVLQAIIGVVFLNKELKFKVTPKGVTGARPLPINVIMPYVVLVAITTIVVIAVGDARQAAGYYFLSLLNGLEYTVVLWAVIYLHYRENREKLTQSPFVFLAKPLALATAVTLSIIVAIILRGSEALDAILYF